MTKVTTKAVEVSPEKIKEAMFVAQYVAANSAKAHLEKNGHGPCGFAWVKCSLPGTTKIVRQLKELGFSKSYEGGYIWWNPGQLNTQSMDTIEYTARLAAKVLNEHIGPYFTVSSRMD